MPRRSGGRSGPRQRGGGSRPRVRSGRRTRDRPLPVRSVTSRRAAGSGGRPVRLGMASSPAWALRTARSSASGARSLVRYPHRPIAHGVHQVVVGAARPSASRSVSPGALAPARAPVGCRPSPAGRCRRAGRRDAHRGPAATPPPAEPASATISTSGAVDRLHAPRRGRAGGRRRASPARVRNGRRQSSGALRGRSLDERDRQEQADPRPIQRPRLDPQLATDQRRALPHAGETECRTGPPSRGRTHGRCRARPGQGVRPPRRPVPARRLRRHAAARC